MSDTYKCDHCGGTFAQAWGDEDAFEELEQNFPGADREDVARVCDDCYKLLMARAGEFEYLRVLKAVADSEDLGVSNGDDKRLAELAHKRLIEQLKAAGYLP